MDDCDACQFKPRRWLALDHQVLDTPHHDRTMIDRSVQMVSAASGGRG
jgi:hypothetical protein